MAIALPVGRQQNLPQAVVETKLAPDDKRQLAFLCFDMRANHSRQRAFVGDRQRRVTDLVRPRDQLLGMRRAAEEGEVGDAMQLGVGHGC